MIEINLRPGVKRKARRLVARTPMLAARLATLGTRMQGSAAAGRGRGLGARASLWLGWRVSEQARQTQRLEPRLEQARQENRRFRNLLAEKRRAEAIRDSLAGADRRHPARGRRSLRVAPHPGRGHPRAAALHLARWTCSPPRAGGTRSDTSGECRLSVSRSTAGPSTSQAYTRFLRQLEASPWMSTWSRSQAQTVVEQRAAGDRVLHPGHVPRADSAYIRTVPLSQSVR